MKKMLIFIAVVIMSAGNLYADTAGLNTGYFVSSDLWIRAVIHTVEKGSVEAVWQKGGENSFEDGGRVIWGYFYASPVDVAWGSRENPDLFVKIWFDRNGRLDVNFFHVSVPDIEVYSDYPFDGIPDRQGITTISERYIRQCYENGGSYMETQYEDGNPSSEYWIAGNPSGYYIGSGLRLGAIIHTVERSPIDAVWHEGGREMLAGGHKVIWGYFYASPDDVNWGSVNNPDLFVKIWFDAEGRIDVNFFHVSVPNIEVYSDFPDNSFYNRKAMTATEKRYIRHEYRYTPDPECSVEKQNEFVYKVMKEESYLWYDKIPETDYKRYASPEELFEALRYKDRDRWSYITSKEAYYTYIISDTYAGLGFEAKFDENDDYRISFVYKESPADKADLHRNDRILEINGKTVREIEDNDLWGNISGPDEDGILVELRIQDSGGFAKKVRLEKGQVKIQPILYQNIYEIVKDEKILKVGYVVFNEFSATSQTALDAVFSYFKWQDIDELILDMRYNGGGIVSVAEYIASLIAGDRFEGEIFAKYLYNDNYKDWNSAGYFTASENNNALDLNRVIFITTDLTASASELLINGLKPFIEVVSVGDTTHGKPVGYSFAWDFCDIHLGLIDFGSVNIYDEGGYFDGIQPTCYADDDLTRSLGDPAEVSLRSALEYLRTGYCDTSSPTAGSGRNKGVEFEGLRREIGAF
jgi:carboxyl-terminal processing protease